MFVYLYFFLLCCKFTSNRCNLIESSKTNIFNQQFLFLFWSIYSDIEEKTRKMSYLEYFNRYINFIININTRVQRNKPSFVAHTHTYDVRNIFTIKLNAALEIIQINLLEYLKENSDKNKISILKWTFNIHMEKNN